MATTNLTEAHVLSGTVGGSTVLKLVNTVDTSANNKAQNDIDQLFDVYAGDVVLSVAVKVTTAEGGTLTFDVGDTFSDATTLFIDGANGNATGWTAMTTALTEAAPNTVLGYWPGKTYTATDTIDVKWLNAADAAVVEFHVNLIRGGA